MASIFKPKGSDKYVINYTDETGRRRKAAGTSDKGVAKQVASKLEGDVALRRRGILDKDAERFAEAERKALVAHVDEWREDLLNRGGTAKHAELSANRVRRLAAVMCGGKPDEVDGKQMTRVQCKEARERIKRLIGQARLSMLTGDAVQEGLATFRTRADRSRHAIIIVALSGGLLSGLGRTADCVSIH